MSTKIGVNLAQGTMIVHTHNYYTDPAVSRIGMPTKVWLQFPKLAAAEIWHFL